MKIKLFILTFILQMYFVAAICQPPTDSIFAIHYKQALHLIDSKDFNGANNAFKQALALNTILPNELAYYYGYTLVNLNKFVAGRNALNKYLQLTGDTGRFKSYAFELIHLADCKEEGSYFTDEECQECHGSGHTMVDCRLCHAKGRLLCNACGGVGAIRRRGNFGDSYYTCPRCAGAGDSMCTQCDGTGIEETRCYACSGKGKVRLKKECDSLLLNLPK